MKKKIFCVSFPLVIMRYETYRVQGKIELEGALINVFR